MARRKAQTSLGSLLALLLAIGMGGAVLALNSTLENGKIVRAVKYVDVYANTTISMQVIASELKVWLLLDNGTSLPDRVVRVRVDGNESVVVTNSLGFASLLLPPGPHNVSAAFEGADHLNPSEASLVVNVTNKTAASVGKTIVPIKLAKEAVLKVEVNYPQKIVRGNEFEITANVTNTGGRDAKNVVVEFYLPSGFHTKEKTHLCGVLRPAETCSFDIVVMPEKNAKPGNLHGRVVVRYEVKTG